MVDLASPEARKRIAKVVYDCPACGDTVAELLADSGYVDMETGTADDVRRLVMEICGLIAGAALSEVAAMLKEE